MTLAFTGGAYAATATAPPKPEAKAPHQPSLAQAIHDQLAEAGYTAIQITPTSFFVQAKDKGGLPVAMEISPSSFTSITGKTDRAPQTPDLEGLTPASSTSSK
jgi:hypothetical protein